MSQKRYILAGVVIVQMDIHICPKVRTFGNHPPEDTTTQICPFVLQYFWKSSAYRHHHPKFVIFYYSTFGNHQPKNTTIPIFYFVLQSFGFSLSPWHSEIHLGII